MTQIRNILVRTPNWLGDLVMSYAFFEQLQQLCPNAQIDVIVKKGLEDLLVFFPVKNHYVFSKKTHKGPLGLMQFGKHIKQMQQYDLFFCLPDSLSSALMGQFIDAKTKIGYANEGRSLLLKHAYPIPSNRHRVYKYLNLLEQYFQTKITQSSTLFPTNKCSPNPRFRFGSKQIVLNLQSVASSRSLSLQKSVALFQLLNQKDYTFVLTGSNAIWEFANAFVHQTEQANNLINLVGQTNLLELSQVYVQSDLVLTVDSGPAHLANSLGCPTVVLFGAGDDTETKPFVPQNLQLLKRQGLDCSPCLKNDCPLKTVECLEELDLDLIVQAVENVLE